MTVYRIVAMLNDGALRATSEEFGTELFTRGAARKDHRCATCGDVISKGQAAWRPLTNGYNRMHRVHLGCFEFPRGFRPR